MPSYVVPDGPTDHRKPEPCTVVVFGAHGDLVLRKLMPSLFHLSRGEHLPEKVLIVGFDRVETDTEAYRKEVAKGQARAPGQQTMMLPRKHDWDDFLKDVFYFRGDLGDPKSFTDLASFVEKLEAERGIPKRRVFYLALPPSIFPNTLRALNDAGLVGEKTRGENCWSRVIIEKPFGRDLESATKLNDLVRSML